MILCWFLSYINMDQPQVYICSLPLEPLSHCPSHPTSQHWLCVPCVIRQIPLAIYFTCGNIYVSTLFFQITPPFSCPTVSRSLFFMSVSPLLPSMQDHLSYLSRFHIHALIHDICLSLFDLLHFVQQALGSSTHQN